MNLHMRSNLFCVVSLCLSLLATSIGYCADNDAKTAVDKPLIKTTHVYKSLGDVKVEADVSRPVVVWIHEAGFGCAAKVPLGH